MRFGLLNSKLNRPVCSEHINRSGFHGFTNPVSHKPSRFISDPKHPMKLVRANAFLARGHKMESQKPFMQGKVGAFKQSSNRNRKMLAAAVTLMKTWAMTLALKFFDLLSLAAMRAKSAVRPAKFFKVLSGLIFIGENWVCEVCAHGS